MISIESVLERYAARDVTLGAAVKMIAVHFENKNLRDEMAGRALSGLISAYDGHPSRIARESYIIADEMMLIRDGFLPSSDDDA